jgi:hypothetical protein
VREIRIRLPRGVNAREVERSIDAAIAAVGLRIALRGTLKKHAGCVHWHVKSGREAGTLEITFEPQPLRAWFTIHDGRNGSWIKDKARRLARAIETPSHPSAQVTARPRMGHS